ncbi:type I restriction endonuclease subunit R [Bifidobacterium samirii]|uniref:Type I restriction enzyme endonuclease subunit n=1 Tax=Bifidobacterium samirii TaxID=2306974 RepID=A0A430FTY0_9BIFI|nr:HsdR family type I site-specific deoxyribonuclease [Bifidobacterium samirii]RSX56377.1 HsdR family type I site-specific deoxyribonuclease [Bifidobacterium samirii]
MGGELEFEMDLIHHLETIGGSKQWKYEPDIKTTEQLWDNFRTILERNNAGRLDGRPLTDGEFSQVKDIICNLRSPYEAGCWLYGMNGVTQVEIDRDELPDGNGGGHVFLDVFDQAQIGAGNTVYQIVNQIQRPRVIAGRKDRRFDTTLLINGLPIIHIEEKYDHHDAMEGLNQIRQYIDEGQFRDIYSTVQILVGMTPHQALYMANTGADSFNPSFAFHWQRETDSVPVSDWREFADLMLSIPMAHQMATNFMILDGDPKHRNLMVMRPYQVYATKRVIERIREHTFGTDDQEVGYVWHTTGSGKTISSFKTAWLASRLPGVDKVVFVVDRVALTRQTFDKYAAYDPDRDEDGNNGVVAETANTGVLASKLRSRSRDNAIVVTSIQKLDRLCKRDTFTAPDQHIVFIVDEAHRSTNGEMLRRIKQAFPLSAWVGYTGTPAFDGDLTHQAFGDLIHAYTIKEAISDRNVLGFNVDFEHTLPNTEVTDHLLPELLRQRYPDWDDQAIDGKIARMSPEEVDEYIDSGVYDNNPQHIREVVDDIIRHWRNRSKDGKYSAILTTHVGGGNPSAPMALQYFEEFRRRNEELRNEGKPALNVAVTFSMAADNSDWQLDNNRGLRSAVKEYNAAFGTSFDDTSIDGYFLDVMDRLRGEAEGAKLDLVIVIDQLLTGYDAPNVNTLYVDRTLSGANLIQAYSRTNRIENMKDKPWGRIVNYRWPETSRKLMDEALKVYANRDSAAVQGTITAADLVDSGVLARNYEETLSKTKKIVEELRELTDEFVRVPASEGEQQQVADLIGEYGSGVSQLKQYSEYDYDQPDVLLDELDMTEDQEMWLTQTARFELKRISEERHELDLSRLDFSVEHIVQVRVNYDYITELFAKLLNQAKEDPEAAGKTYEALKHATDQVEDRRFAEQMMAVADQAMEGEPLEGVSYPVQPEHVSHIVREQASKNRRQASLQFRQKWGLVDVASAKGLIDALLDRHVLHRDDLNDGDELSRLMADAVADRLYQQDADDETIRGLTPIRYRNELRTALREFADYVVAHY